MPANSPKTKTAKEAAGKTKPSAEKAKTATGKGVSEVADRPRKISNKHYEKG